MSLQAVDAALGVRGDEHQSIRLSDGNVTVRLMMQDEYVCCPGCGGRDVVWRGCEVRETHAPPIANRAVSMVIDVPRVQCDSCGTVRQVELTGMAPRHR